MLDLERHTVEQVGEILVDHATAVRAGDKVLIIMREIETYPLVRTTARAAVERGADVQTLFYSLSMQRDLLLSGSDEQIARPPELWRIAMEWADVCIDIRGSRNAAEFAGVDPGKIALLRRAEGRISALRTSGTRWTIIRVPNEAFAQLAGLSGDRIADLFARAILRDWREEARRYEVLRQRVSGGSWVRVTGQGTDLRFSTEGRTWAIDDARINVPGGEIFTAPVEQSVSGTISFEHPGVFAGVLMEGIELTFEDGVVKAARARTNEEFLREILAIDEGAGRLGEFGIGTNRALDSFTNDIFWDEKIFGTIHIALGRSYPQCGGTNESALHWDIVKDLRRRGSIVVDGETLFQDGEWRFPW